MKKQKTKNKNQKTQKKTFSAWYPIDISKQNKRLRMANISTGYWRNEYMSKEIVERKNHPIRLHETTKE